MIIKLDISNKKLIAELSLKFSDIFSNNSIENDFLNNPYTNYLVYLEDNKVIAFLNYYVVYDRMEIVNFNVLEQFQNKHVGSKLLDELFKIARNIKVKNITLEVRCDNEKAIYLYEKYGFKKVSIRKNYYQGVDGILMISEMVK